jgi:hypothetical protein
MANNPDFKKIIVKDVPLLWPRIDQPYRWNSREERSEPCTATVQGAGYSIAWEMPQDEARKFYDALKAHYEDCQQRDSTRPPFHTVFGMKRDTEKKIVTFRAKRNAVDGEGKIKPPPKVTDGQLHDLADKAIWSGSKGGVRVFAFPAKDPQTGNGGVSLTFDAVQVTDPVYGGDGLEDDFGVAPARVSEVDPFDALAPQRPAAAPLSQQAAAKPPASNLVPEDANW